MTVSFPRLSARTLRFTLGVPRGVTVSPDGATVRFIRTADGTTRTGHLWEFDVATGEETRLVDADDLLGGDEELSEAEKSRRERLRESAAGLVSYDVDPTGRWACFALSGRLFATHLGAKSTRELPAAGSIIDPRLDPTGRRIAYATGGALHVIGVDGQDDRALVEPESATQVWGQAEFIAAEEMERYRGFWWAPDGQSLLVERYDEAPVDVWHIADPENPEKPAREQRYPAAGTPNADVTLWHVPLDGDRTEIVGDREAFEYLGRVLFDAHGAVIQVLSRDQKRSQYLAVDLASGTTSVLEEVTSPAWVELGSTPQRTDDGDLVTHDAVARMAAAAGWYLRGIVEVEGDHVLATASDANEPEAVQVVRIHRGAGTVTSLTEGFAVHGVVTSGDTSVIVRADLEGTTLTVHAGESDARRIATVNEPFPFAPAPQFVRLGERGLSAAVLFPRDHTSGTALPILMDPYGGPHAQRVLASGRMFLEPQWLADQGFCVVVADGRGTPGRTVEWEHEILDDFAGVTLQDQVDAVAAVAEQFPDADASRVGIKGWSYGGYLAALAVLARPDVFHAAVAGAPVTEWRLYDTCYTERYLGDPTTKPEVYDANSLLPLADQLERPLMLIHGLADDNVVAAHTLRLSSALLAAGKPHTVLPLSGVTHMTPQEVVAENLALLQVEFLKDALGS